MRAASVRATPVKTSTMKAASVKEPSMKAPVVKEPSVYKRPIPESIGCEGEGQEGRRNGYLVHPDMLGLVCDPASIRNPVGDGSVTAHGRG
jgi:hypothetical protein